MSLYSGWVGLDRPAPERKLPAGAPLRAPGLLPKVPRKGATKMMASRGRARKSRKGGKKAKKGNSSGSRLRDVSASNVSLQDAADFFKAVWTYGKYALGTLNAEMKEYYNTIYNGVVGGVLINQVLFIAQGTDYNQRIGDSVKVANVRVEYLLAANVTALTNFTRIILLRDFMNLGQLPGITDVLQDTSTNALAITSPYLHSLGDRFEVLYDMVHAQTYASDNGVIHERRAFGINDHVLWKGSTNSAADTWQGHFVFIVISDQATNAAKLQLSLLAQYVDD